MEPVDMSAKAVTARLKRMAQLRRLSLSLQKAKLPPPEDSAKKTSIKQDRPARPTARKAK